MKNIRARILLETRGNLSRVHSSTRGIGLEGGRDVKQMETLEVPDDILAEYRRQTKVMK